MADAGTNEFTGPDPQETSRSLEALKALTTEILNLRTTMRSQEKDLEKMTAAELAARKEQVSKLNALTDAQKVAIELAADEALSLASAGKATDQLIEKVIKQTRLAERAEKLVQSELKSRDALNQQIVAATKQEDERRIKGAATQKLMAAPSTSLKAVAEKERQEGTGEGPSPLDEILNFIKTISENFGEILNFIKTISENFNFLINLGQAIHRNGLKVYMVNPSGSSGGSGSGSGGGSGGSGRGGGGGTDSDVPFQKAMAALAGQITKLVPQFSAFTDRVGTANNDYDKFIDSVKNAYGKMRELLTVSGLLNFLLRIVGVSVFFVLRGIKDLAVNGFGFLKDKIKNLDFQKISDKLKAGVNNAATQIENTVKNIKTTFTKGMENLSKGFDKVADGVSKFRDKVLSTASQMGKDVLNGMKTSMKFFEDGGKNILNTTKTLMTNAQKISNQMMQGIKSFASNMGSAMSSFASKSLQMAQTMGAQGMKFASTIGAASMSIATKILGLMMSIGPAILTLATSLWTLVGSFISGAITFTTTVIAPMVMSALGFVGSILVAIGSFVAGIAMGVISFIGALIAPILPFILIAAVS